MESIVNKVAESGLVSINLEDYLPKGEILIFDLKPFLFMEMILKEKDFRAAIQIHNWQQYLNKYIAIQCSVDVIIPMWANMLVATYLQPIATEIYFGNKTTVENILLLKNINLIDENIFKDKRIVVKGCGEKQISEVAYVAITAKLIPVAKSIMYGEPCSTVPIYKRPKV